MKRMNLLKKLAPLALMGTTTTTWAQEAALNSGDTAWVLISTALVLLMTPGLAFFYAGMVGKKNVVATLFQNMVAISILGIMWVMLGYSLCFSGNISGLIGDLAHGFFAGVGGAVKEGLTIPHSIFAFFQCMFAVITPALIIGAFAERVHLKAWLFFAVLWSLAVYYPVCHWVWGSGGVIASLGGLDFAGGLVVHMTAGYSALIFALFLGRGKEFMQTRPYDVGMVTLGTTLLFFGWFGFNAGSALAASGLAAQAFGTTFICAVVCALTWSFMDYLKTRKPTLTGFCVGIVAGLVVITPAAGFVGFGHAILMGIVGGVLCNLALGYMKNIFKVDDRLDVFACHGIGGTLGSLMTGIFASPAINPSATEGLLFGGVALFKAQLISIFMVAIYSMIVTFVILKVLSLFMKINADDASQSEGLDSSDHGEEINNYLKVV